MGLALPCACFAPSLREVRKWDYQALLKKFPFQRTLVSLLGAEWHILKRQLQVKASGQREFGEHLPETSGGARGPGGEGEGRTSVWLGGRRPRAIRVDLSSSYSAVRGPHGHGGTEVGCGTGPSGSNGKKAGVGLSTWAAPLLGGSGEEELAPLCPAIRPFLPRGYPCLCLPAFLSRF